MRERRAIPVYSFTRVRSTNTKCTRGCGCNGHPAVPTPSLGESFINDSGAWRGEGVNMCLDVIASQRAALCADPLARNDGRGSGIAEPVIGRAFARPVGSQ